MASTLSQPKLAVSISGLLSSGAAPAIVSGTILHQQIIAMAVGASAGQVNKAYSTAVAVSTGTPLVIDLTAAVDPNGTTNNFTKVATFLFTGANAVSQVFTIGGGTTPLFTTEPNPINAVDGCYLWSSPSAPLTVDSTHKLVQITVAAGTNIAGLLTIIGQ